MKLSDVVSKIAQRMPSIDPRFCETFVAEVDEVNEDHFTVKVDKNAKIKTGQNVLISKIANKNPVMDMKRTTDIYSFTMQNDHGLNYDKNVETTITIAGDEEEKFKGTLEGVLEYNQMLVYSQQNFGLTEAYLEMQEGFNGHYTVTEVTESPDDPDIEIIKVPILKRTFTPAYQPASRGFIQTAIRVVGVPDMDRFNALYTMQAKNELWLAVTAPENRSSRDRGVTTDSIIAYMDPTASSGPMEIRQTHIETVSVYCAIPASYLIDGLDAVDVAEEVRFALYRALCGVDIPSQANSSERYPLMPVRDGYFSYLSDSTTYIHEYVFERSIVLTVEDVGQPESATAPYRSLELNLVPSCKG